MTRELTPDEDRVIGVVAKLSHVQADLREVYLHPDHFAPASDQAPAIEALTDQLHTASQNWVHRGGEDRRSKHRRAGDRRSGDRRGPDRRG